MPEEKWERYETELERKTGETSSQPDYHSEDEAGGTARRGRVQPQHCARISSHGRSCWWLSGNVEGENFCERTFDCMARKASHAGIPKGVHDEFRPQKERVRHRDVIGSEWRWPGAAGKH